ncbi:glycosyl transferase family 41-domain-containing protein [Cunninghamella echinulata]|nr:glycosyl transferase family 41-domain-containing protein [Cunninghamella echinulata]
MVPPQSPTLATYYYENSNGWVNHYYDVNKYSLSPRVQSDVQLHPINMNHEQQPQQIFSSDTILRQQQQQQQLVQQQLLQQSTPLHHHPHVTPPHQSLHPHHQQQQQHELLHKTNIIGSQYPLSQQQQVPFQHHHQTSSRPISHILTPQQSIATTQLNQIVTTLTNSTTSPPNPIALYVIHPYASKEHYDEWRENILQYAHNLYSTSPQSPLLLQLLHSLHNAFPRHLPTILLLACVYYTHQDYQASLRYNHLILKYDPNYVEAMSNIGTTLRSLGKTNEAERWWYQAVQLRPGYWDAVENLVGVLCSTNDNLNQQKLEKAGTKRKASLKTSDKIPRYKEALGVCEYVEQHFFGQDAHIQQQHNHHIRLPNELPLQQLPRLQNLFYAKGNLKYALGDILGAKWEYEKGLDLVFNGMSWESVIQHLAFVCTGGSTMASTTTTSPAASVPLILVQPDQAVRFIQIAFASTNGVLPGLVNANNQNNTISSPTSTTTNSHLMDAHRNTNANQANSSNIIQQSNQTTSTIMLTLAKLFQDLMNPSTPALVSAAAALSQQSASSASSASASASASSASASASTSIPSLALLLPLYYLSLALSPSPSTANNLGIILSNLPNTVTSTAIRLMNLSSHHPTSQSQQQQQQPLTGTMLAMQYYMYGLQLDQRHPHLYTNLGSLLKDMGHLNEAVAMYEKAVEYNPKFDVALANLGNTVKDMGRVQDSIQWYRRAVEVNPDFVDAVCGLINALGGVCDWRGRGSTLTNVSMESGMVDQYGQWITLQNNNNGKSLSQDMGWMSRLVDIVDKQLDEGSSWSAGILQQQQQQIKLLFSFPSSPLSTTITSSSKDWIRILMNGLFHRLMALDGTDISFWEKRIAYYIGNNNNNDTTSIKENNNNKNKNEGGWIVRLVERLTRRLQRQWYVNTYGTKIQSLDGSEQPIHVTPEASAMYARPLLSSSSSSSSSTSSTSTSSISSSVPSSVNNNHNDNSNNINNSTNGNNMNMFMNMNISPMLSTSPPVPTVLPFHTFTYPLTARQVRLISHRNALRITHSTLSSSSWLPSHVYPPPPPPQPRLKIGYVSSDFNNHPLAHLMQSVFGFHDRQRCEVYCYAITASDQSPYRKTIEQGAEHFLDVSTWSNQQVIDQILSDGIHVLVNLNGYTKGARNEIFAARPCPVQCSFMGFAGTLGGGWCDWIIADPIVCPPFTVSCEQWRQQHQQNGSFQGGDLDGDLDPESARDDFVYTEKFIYMPHSYFVNDHKQGFREEDDMSQRLHQQLQEKRNKKKTMDYLSIQKNQNDSSNNGNNTPTLMMANMTVSNNNENKDKNEYRHTGVSSATTTTASSSLSSSSPSSSLPSSSSSSSSSSYSSSTSTNVTIEKTSLSSPTNQEEDDDELVKAIWKNEEIKRWKMRKEVFPDLPDNVVIFANFNQLYKLDPSTFRLWLRILSKVPNSILWLLRFPPAGEQHLKRFATTWAGAEVSSRVVFTDVAPKHIHIHRGRIADIFLDTPECNAHTTAADILWSGTPIVTYPKYQHKMCSRVGASIAFATGHGNDMVVHTEQEYEDKVVQWAQSLSYIMVKNDDYNSKEEESHENENANNTNMNSNSNSTLKEYRHGIGPLMTLRKKLFLTRETSRLFDTHRWTKNLETGLLEAWRRWVLGYEFEDYLPHVSSTMSSQDKKQLAMSGCIWIKDNDD